MFYLQLDKPGTPDQHQPQDPNLLGSPELFEPNPLCQFFYPMADTGLSESCPSGSLSFKSKQEVEAIMEMMYILNVFALVHLWILKCENTSVGS